MTSSVSSNTGRRAAGPHFAIVTSPVPGHFNPLTTLALALQDRGARVSFVHVGDAEKLLKGAPVGFRAVGTTDYPPGALRRYAARLGTASGLIGTMRMVVATARLCDMLCREAPAAIRAIGADVVIADVAEPAGALVARHLDLPFIGVIVGLPLHPDPIVPPAFLGWGQGRTRRELVLIRRAYRVTSTLMYPITRVLRRHARAWGLPGDPTDVLSPLLTVAQCPPGLDFTRTLPSPPTAWCGPFRSVIDEEAELPPRDGRPLIFCSLGTLQGGRYAMFRIVAAACAAIGARAIIAHCGLLTEAQVRSLPGDPVVRAFWPQRAVLREVQGAIVHGGFNTVLDALGAGVPMVALPIAFEQPGTSARLDAAGVAIVIPRRKLTQRRLQAALGRILHEPGFAAAAQGFADQLRDVDGATYAADRILAACDRLEPGVATERQHGRRA